jgi:[acyl-carrier-protein] S-malonyltransferase
MLQVSAPFHCALMQPAQNALARDLATLTFHDPHFPVASNVDARLLTRGTEVAGCLTRQVTGPVRWVECIQLLIEGGATHFIETGPGKVLSGLMRQIDRNQKTLNVEDAASLEKTLAALTANETP